MQDYKSLCATVTICSTLFNIQTHTDSTLTSSYVKLSQLSYKQFLQHFYIILRCYNIVNEDRCHKKPKQTYVESTHISWYANL